VRPGVRFGAEDRSISPSSPACCQRAYHFATHRRETPASTATWAIGRPPSMRSHKRRRPAGVNGALGCDTLCSRHTAATDLPRRPVCDSDTTLRPRLRRPVRRVRYQPQPRPNRWPHPRARRGSFANIRERMCPRSRLHYRVSSSRNSPAASM
jgi:hypothetical protein